MSIGINTDDFTANMLADLGQTVTHTPVTKTVNNFGVETLTEGTPTPITVFIHIGRSQYLQEKQGLSEDAVGYIMFDPALTITRDDKITLGSTDYRVGSVIERNAGLNVAVYGYAEIYLWNK